MNIKIPEEHTQSMNNIIAIDPMHEYHIQTQFSKAEMRAWTRLIY